MGLRFRKSVSLGKFFRLNLSKSGVSLGVGPRGLNVNIGPRGVRQTVGLPGTGIYYQETKAWPKSTESSPLLNSVSENATLSDGRVIGIIFVVVVVIAIIFDANSPTTVRKDSGSAAKITPQPTAQTPKPNRPLNRDEVREFQTLLRNQGFDIGMPDGVIGPNTRAASQAFARAHRINAQDGISLRLLEAARSYRK